MSILQYHNLLNAGTKHKKISLLPSISFLWNNKEQRLYVSWLKFCLELNVIEFKDMIVRKRRELAFR